MKKLCFTALILAALATNGAFAGELSWVDGNGRSCGQVCRDHDAKAVSYGELRGEKFYVCATNGNAGWNKPGFNLLPSWSEQCYINGNPGHENDSKYVCLCHDRRSDRHSDDRHSDDRRSDDRRSDDRRSDDR